MRKTADLLGKGSAVFCAGRDLDAGCSPIKVPTSTGLLAELVSGIAPEVLPVLGEVLGSVLAILLATALVPEFVLVYPQFFAYQVHICTLALYIHPPVIWTLPSSAP